MSRPSVSVIVPFVGTDAQLSELVQTLGTLRLRADDEIIVADNRPHRHGEAPSERVEGQLTVRPAAGISSPGFARNRAGAVARGEWLVMIDADTDPARTLLDDYFAPLPEPHTAILAGAVIDRASSRGLAARRSALRGQMNQRTTLERGPWSYVQSVNCAVRRSAFVRAGGFDEFARAGEDADLCFRLRADGWAIEARMGASVTHRTRDSITALLTQLVRHGSGAAWAQSRHPGSFPPPRAERMAARVLGAGRRAVLAAGRGDGDTARMHLLELAEACAFEGGRFVSNRARLLR